MEKRFALMMATATSWTPTKLSRKAARVAVIGAIPSGRDSGFKWHVVRPAVNQNSRPAGEY
jgi:hypothetical protein